MADPQTLEEAWGNHGLARASEERDGTARALALGGRRWGAGRGRYLF